MNRTERSREARLRRLAQKNGYSLHKSRSPESYDNFGGFMIVETDRNLCIAGGRYDLDLDAVEAWLSD